jgi:rare lipoprotein A (peptidoglycan hydrolase)
MVRASQSSIRAAAQEIELTRHGLTSVTMDMVRVTVGWSRSEQAAVATAELAGAKERLDEAIKALQGAHDALELYGMGL